MSQENVELVRSVYESWERGDYRRTDWQAPEIEFAMVDGPTPGRWIGATGIGRAWGDFLSAWEDFRHAGDDYRELDDERVLVLFHFSGRGKRSGLEVERMGSRAAGVFYIGEGKVTRIDLYFDRAHGLEAVGLRG